MIRLIVMVSLGLFIVIGNIGGCTTGDTGDGNDGEPRPTAQPTPTPTPGPTPTMGPGPTPTSPPGATPPPEPTPTGSPEPTPSGEPTPTGSPEPTPTGSPEPTPTSPPGPTPTPGAPAAFNCSNLPALNDPAFSNIRALFLGEALNIPDIIFALTTNGSGGVIISSEIFASDMGTVTGPILGATTFDLDTLNCSVQGCPIAIDCCGECSLIGQTLTADVGLADCSDSLPFVGQCQSVEANARTQNVP